MVVVFSTMPSTLHIFRGGTPTPPHFLKIGSPNDNLPFTVLDFSGRILLISAGMSTTGGWGFLDGKKFLSA
jgi:hypothetical protein